MWTAWIAEAGVEPYEARVWMGGLPGTGGGTVEASGRALLAIELQLELDPEAIGLGFATRCEVGDGRPTDAAETELESGRASTASPAPSITRGKFRTFGFGLSRRLEGTDSDVVPLEGGWTRM